MSRNAENGGIQKCEENIKKSKVEKFPILKLPDLVREMVIRLMNPVEIFDFSQTSKRMHKTVQRSCRHKTYHLHLQAGQIYQAALYPPTYRAIPAEPARFRFQLLNDETERDPKYDRHFGNFQKIHANFQEEKGLYFFHKSHWEITKELIAELQKLMDIKFQQVRIFLDGIENRDHKPLIEWLNTFPDGIKLSYIYGDLVSNENMVDLMQNYQCKDTLRFYGRLRGFKIDPLPLKATDLRIDHTHWMTVQNVLQMENVVAFKLGNAHKFTDIDYNTILKAIISGALPKMVYVHLELKRRYDRDVICQDIPLIQKTMTRNVRRALHKAAKTKFGNSKKQTNKLIKCQGCGKSVSSQDALRQHVRFSQFHRNKLLDKKSMEHWERLNVEMDPCSLDLTLLMQYKSVHYREQKTKKPKERETFIDALRKKLQLNPDKLEKTVLEPFSMINGKAEYELIRHRPENLDPSISYEEMLLDGWKAARMEEGQVGGMETESNTNVEELRREQAHKGKIKRKLEKKAVRGGRNSSVSSARRRQYIMPENDYLQGPIKVNNRMRADPKVVLSTMLTDVLNELKSLEGSDAFLFPVNPKQVTDYYNIIKNPISFQDIKNKIASYSYQLRKEFIEDIRLMHGNSRMYNGENHMLTMNAADILKRAGFLLALRDSEFMKLEKQINPLLDSNDEVGFCYVLDKIIKRVRNIPKSAPFHTKVDGKRFPSYYVRIQNPIDLGTIEQKNKRHEYQSIDDFLKDMRLILDNSLAFNGEASIYTAKAKEIWELTERLVQEEMETLVELENSINPEAAAARQAATSEAEVTADEETMEQQTDEHPTEDEDDELEEEMEVDTGDYDGQPMWDDGNLAAGQLLNELAMSDSDEDESADAVRRPANDDDN